MRRTIPSFDVKGACQAFYKWKKHKKADIMTFRNNAIPICNHRHDGAHAPHTVEGRFGRFHEGILEKLTRNRMQTPRNRRPTSRASFTKNLR